MQFFNSCYGHKIIADNIFEVSGDFLKLLQHNEQKKQDYKMYCAYLKVMAVNQRYYIVASIVTVFGKIPRFHSFKAILNH